MQKYQFAISFFPMNFLWEFPSNPQELMPGGNLMRNLTFLLTIMCGLIFSSACTRKADENTQTRRQTAPKYEQAPGKVPSQPEVGSRRQEVTRPAPRDLEPEPVYAPPRRSQRNPGTRPSTAPQRPKQPTYSVTAPAESPSLPRPATPEPVPLPETSAPVEPSSPDLRRAPRQEEVIAQQPESVPLPPPREEKMVIPAGTEFTVRTLDRISSEDARSGERFAAILDTDIYENGKVVIPANSEVTGKLVSVQQAGKIGGRAEMVLELESINIRGVQRDLRTSKLAMHGESSAKEDTAKIGGGAALGAVLGAITGGKKGAIIGATVGAGAGTVAVVTGRGKPLRIGPESRLHFRLEQPLEVVIR